MLLITLSVLTLGEGKVNPESCHPKYGKEHAMNVRPKVLPWS